MRGKKLAYLSLISLILISSSHSKIYAETSSGSRNFTIDVLEVVPHNATSFTQGLEMFDGNMLESSGLYGKSRLSEVDIVTGEVIRQIIFNESIFSEGITVRKDSVIMLTWREQIAFEVDLNDFQVVGNYSYQGEGWGLCFNGNHFVMTNGSSDLIFRDPHSFEVDFTIGVVLDGVKIGSLNELECVEDIVYANVWMTDNIVAINSSSGEVVFSATTSLISQDQGNNRNEVLNGIAFDQSSGGFWITGKNWTEMYLVDFIPEDNIGKKDPIYTNGIFLVLFSIFLCFIILYLKFRTNLGLEKPNFKDHHQ